MLPMPNPTEAISHWIDAQPEGALIGSLDLEHLVDRNHASRALARLAQRGRLMRVARGMYVAVTASRFGPVPPPVDMVIQSLAQITGHAIVRHGAAAANALGLTTQVPARQIYLTEGRAQKHALANGQFLLYFQPKVNMRTGEVLGAEALIRWQHPTRGLLSPASFIPIIENHPLGIDVGKWTIEAALTQIEVWRKAGLHVPISVNIGARHLLQPDFIMHLRGMLSRHPGAQPQDLELEILETSAVEDFVQVSQLMALCERMGLRFALDDFGSGYSSLAYLKRLPAHLLKIDQGFIRDMLEDPDDIAILDALLALARSFGRNCIAEGVESIRHGEMLLRMGCEWGQGYAIGHPMPAHEFEQWLHTWQVPLSWKGFKPDSRSALPVPFTYVDHRVWISQMIDYLSGKTQVPPQPEALQYWRDQSGRPTFFGKAPDDQVDVLHQSIQQLAHTLSEMKNAGRVEALRAGIDKLQHLQADLLGLLPPDQKPD